MVERVSFHNYEKEIESLNEESDKKIARRYVELFFSFDIVNSSAYKTLNFTGWSKVIVSLFKEIEQTVIKIIPSAAIWRILGDEVIFIVQIKENKDFFIYTNSIFDILNNMVYQLKTGLFFEHLEFSDNEKALMKMQNIISLKAAAWIAIIGDGIKYLEQYDNLVEHYKLREGYGISEFLGNDIDAGFRIKKETEDRRLTISFELAYILARDTEYLNKINIITYKKLKGIWHDRLYPIIWYHEPKYVNNILFENSFYYDEKENSDLVKEYFKNREEPLLSREMYENVYDALHKMLIDQGLKDKIEKINNIIETYSYSKNTNNLLEHDFLLRLHCVAVCYDKETKKILIAKRANYRKRLPEHWEFGCAKGTLENSLISQIEQEYAKDFNISIKVVCDEVRDDKQPVPIALYEFDNKNGKDKGIIVLAEIVGNYDINKYNGTKHSELKWIDESEIDKFSLLCVQDFKNTLKAAFKMIHERSQDK